MACIYNNPSVLSDVVFQMLYQGYVAPIDALYSIAEPQAQPQHKSPGLDLETLWLASALRFCPRRRIKV